MVGMCVGRRGLVNASGSWVGGSATLVQTGDIMDRGPDSLALLRLFWRLKGEAAAANGTVVTLLVSLQSPERRTFFWP